MIQAGRVADGVQARGFLRVYFRYALIASMCLGCSTPPPAAAGHVSAASATMADTELRDYQLRALRARILGMPESPERDYFSGMLAARSGRFSDAIVQLDRALPHLRESQPKRAAIALEAIGTARRANNQYGDAARAYAELSDRFADQLDRFPADDAALARILNQTPRKRSHGRARYG